MRNTRLTRRIPNRVFQTEFLLRQSQPFRSPSMDNFSFFTFLGHMSSPHVSGGDPSSIRFPPTPEKLGPALSSPRKTCGNDNKNSPNCPVSQIGRASCRERGENSVGAVSLK